MTDYRPIVIQFNVSVQDLPELLGEFKTAEEAEIFMAKHYFAINTGITVARHMDNFEKSELRKKVNDILENRMPILEQDLREANETFNAAKKAKEDACGMVTAFTNEAKMIAVEVKRGLKNMKLDEQFTWKIPYKSKFYFYTFIDNKIRLVKVSEMTTNEKTELFSQGKVNEDIFDKGILPEKCLTNESESIEFNKIQADLNNNDNNVSANESDFTFDDNNTSENLNTDNVETSKEKRKKK